MQFKSRLFLDLDGIANGVNRRQDAVPVVFEAHSAGAIDSQEIDEMVRQVVDIAEIYVAQG